MIRRVRLALVIVICVVLQTTLFTHLRIDGVVPEVGLVAVLAVAFYDGAESGAWFGFAMGLSIDLFLSTPLGLSALSYAITGYAVGVVQSGMVRTPPAIAPLLGGLGGFFGGLVFLAVGAVVGQEGFLSLASLKTVAIAALYDALIAPIVFPLVRRATRHPKGTPAWRVSP
jgi:rod shape-determining protein MreD